MKKIVKRILIVIGVLFFLFCIFIGYGVGINNRYYKLLVVTSGSMSPTFNAGDLIFITQMDPEKLKIDDIVTFQTKEEMLLTHRVVGIKSDGEIITRGDANNGIDTWSDGWKLVKVETKYVFKIPKLGYFISWWSGIFHGNGTGAWLNDSETIKENKIVADTPTPESLLSPSPDLTTPEETTSPEATIPVEEKSTEESP